MLHVTYLGQCGFLLDFGDTRIVTDPHLSDYVGKTCYSPQTPWQRLYLPPVDLMTLKPDGILISHSHEDHLDPWTLKPYFQLGGTCPVAVPAPVCETLTDLLAPNLIPARAEESFFIGSIKITPIPCAHTQLHLDGEGRFYELSYLLEHEGLRVFFGGDMSLYDGLYKRLSDAGIHVLLLPVNGRDEKRTSRGIIGNINCTEAANLASCLDAPVYIPMHFDLYEINGCAPDDIKSAAKASGANLFLLKPMQVLEIQGFGKAEIV